MNVHFGKVLLGGFLVAMVATAPLGATSIGAGSFNLQGTIEITASTLYFGNISTPPPPSAADQQARIQPPLTGVFASGGLSLVGNTTPATIHNISSQPTFPSGNLSVPMWVILPDGVNFDVQNVPFNTSIGNCNGTSDSTAAGFECRPLVGGTQSPIILEQTQTGVTALVDFTGIAYTGSSLTGSSAFSAVLAADFSNLIPGYGTIDQLLNTFATQTDSAGNNYVATGYQANFAVTPIPEPGMLAALGLGVFAFGAFRKKSYRKEK